MDTGSDMEEGITTDFFAKYRTKKVGLAFYDQLTDKIPKEEFDQKLDYLVTEKGIIEY